MMSEQAAAKAGEKVAGNGTAGAPVGQAGAEGRSGEAQKPQPKLSPEALKKIAEMRNRMQGLVGQVVMVLSVVPRYRHQMLADLHHLVV